jgi:hypothetical protein
MSTIFIVFCTANDFYCLLYSLMTNTVQVQPKHVAHSIIYKVCCNDLIPVGIIDSKHKENGRYSIKNNKYFFKFKVCKSVHHRTIKINQPTRCSNF